MSGVAELSTAATASTASKTGGDQMYDERETKSVRESLMTLGRSVGPPSGDRQMVTVVYEELYHQYEFRHG